LSGDRGLDADQEGRAHRQAHRSAHEGEILDADHRLIALDRPLRVDQRVALAGLGARRLDAIGIALAVAELQRILAAPAGWDRRVDAAVEDHGRSAVGADAAMMLALRADRLVLLIFLAEEHRPAARAFVPEIVGRFLLGWRRRERAYGRDRASSCCLSCFDAA
jgi:hypothetical protein